MTQAIIELICKITLYLQAELLVCNLCCPVVAKAVVLSLSRGSIVEVNVESVVLLLDVGNSLCYLLYITVAATHTGVAALCISSHRHSESCSHKYHFLHNP